MPTCLPCSLRRENGFQPTHTQYTHHSLLLHHAGIMPPNPGVLGWHLLLLPPTTSDQLRSVFHHGPITAYHGITNTFGTEMAVAQHCRCQRNAATCLAAQLDLCSFQFFVQVLRPTLQAPRFHKGILLWTIETGDLQTPKRHSRYSRYSLEDLEMCCEVSPQCSAVNDLFTEYVILYYINRMYIYIHIYIILL